MAIPVLFPGMDYGLAGPTSRVLKKVGVAP